MRTVSLVSKYEIFSILHITVSRVLSCHDTDSSIQSPLKTTLLYIVGTVKIGHIQLGKTSTSSSSFLSRDVSVRNLPLLVDKFAIRVYPRVQSTRSLTFPCFFFFLERLNVYVRKYKLPYSKGRPKGVFKTTSRYQK